MESDSTMPFDLNPDPNAPAEQRWIMRRYDESPTDDTWLSVDVDMKHPDDPEPLHGYESPLHSHPPKRRVQVHVGGPDELVEMLRASDRLRTRLLRRDLQWIFNIIRASGMELSLVREANEDD
jgi:hypothetical protein